MDNLFEEDEIQSPPEKPADLPPTDSRDAVYRLHYHLRRCGATNSLAGDIADKLLERLSSNPIRLRMFCCSLVTVVQCGLTMNST